MADNAAAPARATFGGWLFWWVIDARKLNRQVAEYDRLKWYQSARGRSFALLAFSVATATLIVEFRTHDRWQYVDIVVFGTLAVFIYRGHRWAAISAMILLSLEKILQVYTQVISGHAWKVIPITFFWTIYMYCLHLAYQTEVERRKRAAVNIEVFN